MLNDLARIIERMTRIDQDERPSAEEVLEENVWKKLDKV
jgi:hypothetical protein